MLNTLSKILMYLLLTSYTSVFPLVADEIKDQKIIQLERLLKVYIEENKMLKDKLRVLEASPNTIAEGERTQEDNLQCKDSPSVCSKEEICKLATSQSINSKRIWKSGSFQKFVDEAKRQELDCGVSIFYDPATEITKKIVDELKVTEEKVTEEAQIASKEEVKLMQSYLNSLGYLVGNVDGLWGSKTENAVKKFLSDKEIMSHNKFDKKVFALIKKDFLMLPINQEKLGSIKTSTDIRISNLCNAIEADKHKILWKRMRQLKKKNTQHWSNIGIDQILDLNNDGTLEAVAINYSLSANRFHGKTIKFSSTDKALMTDSTEGITFLNEQPYTKEIRKLVPGDLNSDGIMDMVFFDYGEHDGSLHDGKVIALMSQRSSYIWKELSTPKNLRIHTGTLIDIDSDGDLDIVYGAVGNGKNTIFALKNYDSNFTQTKPVSSIRIVGMPWVSFNSSDIDGDGHHDMIVERINTRTGSFGMQILWGSSLGIFDKTKVTQVESAMLGKKDLLMDSLAINRGNTTEIYAVFAENNYQGGSKIVKYTFDGRKQIDEALLGSGRFKTSRWINTVYPCKSGLKMFMLAGSGATNIRDQMQ